MTFCAMKAKTSSFIQLRVSNSSNLEPIHQEEKVKEEKGLITTKSPNSARLLSRITSHSIQSIAHLDFFIECRERDEHLLLLLQGEDDESTG